MPDPHSFPSPPNSPAAHRDSPPRDVQTHSRRASQQRFPGEPQYWAKRRRIRHSRIERDISSSALKEPRSRSDPAEAKGRLLEFRRLLRAAARDVAWQTDPKTPTKVVKLSPLANALRSARIDEDDLIDGYLASAAQPGVLSEASNCKLDFDSVNAIVFLRQFVRRVVQQKLEHPDAEMRTNADEFFNKLNAKSIKRHIPVPKPIWDGPSFYYAAQKFELSSQLSTADSHHMDDDYSSSSSDDEDSDDQHGYADYGADMHGYGHVHAAGTNTPSAFASVQDLQRRARRRHGAGAAPSNFAWMIQKYTEHVCEQWNSTVPHLFQLLNPLPECGIALSQTLGSIFKKPRSDIREAEAYYLFAAASAQVGCYPLVCMAESRLISSCSDNDPYNYESWISNGIDSASQKIEQLARFGQRLAKAPWDVTAKDVECFVDEYVRIYREQQSLLPLARQRGDSSSNNSNNNGSYHQQQLAASRNPSMSSGPVYQILATPKDFSRRSIEESAIRDLVHAVVVMAVGHGLGSFANASGMVPDIDHPAGSYFDRLENLLPVEQSAGPPCIDTLGPDAAKSQQQPVYQPKQPTVDMVETAERNTAHLLDTLRELSFAEHSPDPVFLHIYQHSQPCVSQHPPPPPRSVLHRISGVSTRANALLAALTYTDPLENPQAQFAAYREMRKTKLARYELLPVDGQMLLADTVVGSTTTTAAYSSFSSGQPTVNSTSLSTRQSAFELGVHSYPQSATQASFDVMSLPSLASQPRSVSQPHSPRQSQRIQSLHLSQRDDLHWDMLSGYLRQRLSIENDTLGNEVQAARTLAGRPLVDPDTSHPPDVDYAISLVDTRKAPLKAGRTQPTEERESDSMMYDDGAAVDIRSKVYDLANAMPMANVPFSRHYHKNIDTRHFHDAIWHFTLSFYHIYEEYYFYSKHKDDELPDNTQPDAVRRADTSDTSDTRHPASNSTFAAPASGAPTADMMMEVDLSADTAHTGQTKSTASPHYSRWLTKELKDHIRAVVRNSSSISAVMAQSPVATGLNLSAAELVRINLIISLAQRQAEITHGIRAIREFERTRL